MQACSDPRQGGTQQLKQHRLVPGHEVPHHRVPWSLGLSQSPPPFSVFLLGHDVARLQGSSDKFTSCSLKAIVIKNLCVSPCFTVVPSSVTGFGTTREKPPGKRAPPFLAERFPQPARKEALSAPSFYKIGSCYH